MSLPLFFKKWARRVHYVVRMFIESAFILGFSDWFYFWFTSKEKPIIIKGIRFNTRKGTINKISDLSMLFEVMIYGNYSKYKIKDNDTIIDIGGHIGGFSVPAAKIAKRGRVYSFEPFPETFKYLKKNSSQAKNLIVFPVAISEKAGKMKFNISKSNPAENSLYKKGDLEVVVRTITLTEVFKKNKIKECNLLKVDCEGAEYGIFWSSVNILPKIKNIILEYHDPTYFGVSEKYSVAGLVNLLNKNGFSTEVKETNHYQGIIFATKKN